MTNQLIDTQTRPTTKRHTVKRCVHCGADSGLVRRTYYRGGTGYVPVIECADQAACSERWARGHGIVWRLPVAP